MPPYFCAGGPASVVSGRRQAINSDSSEIAAAILNRWLNDWAAAATRRTRSSPPICASAPPTRSFISSPPDKAPATCGAADCSDDSSIAVSTATLMAAPSEREKAAVAVATPTSRRGTALCTATSAVGNCLVAPRLLFYPWLDGEE